MKKVWITLGLIVTLQPGLATAQSLSAIVPVLKGAYAPASAGCDVAAAAFIYIEDNDIGANKTTGKVKSVKRDGDTYVLDVLWVEAGSADAEGDPDTVRIEVEDARSFSFSNTTSRKTLMKWCS
jgi:hypothetical protein